MRGGGGAWRSLTGDKKMVKLKWEALERLVLNDFLDFRAKVHFMNTSSKTTNSCVLPNYFLF